MERTTDLEAVKAGEPNVRFVKVAHVEVQGPEEYLKIIRRKTTEVGISKLTKGGRP